MRADRQTYTRWLQCFCVHKHSVNITLAGGIYRKVFNTATQRTIRKCFILVWLHVFTIRIVRVCDRLTYWRTLCKTGLSCAAARYGTLKTPRYAVGLLSRIWIYTVVSANVVVGPLLSLMALLNLKGFNWLAIIWIASFRRAIRLGLYTADDPTPSKLVAYMDDNLFANILYNPHHVFNKFLPDKTDHT